MNIKNMNIKNMYIKNMYIKNMYILNNKIFLVSVLILILFFIIIDRNRKEFFSDYFLELNKSKKIMSNKSYFNHFNKNDYKLRNCKNKQDCINNYSKNTIKFTEREKKILNEFVNDFLNKVGNFKALFENMKFIKVTDNIESSMPHTREDCIVFSEKWINTFLEDNNRTQFYKLLAHEQLHILQRQNPDKFKILYEEYWNLIQIPELPKILKNINRTNPDALPNNLWVFPSKNGYYLPLCIYNNNNSLRDTSNVYFSCENKNNKFIFLNLEEEIKEPKLLSQNKEFTDFFGYDSSNNYHPNEIASSLFEIIIDNQINNKEMAKFPAINKMNDVIKTFRLHL